MTLRSAKICALVTSVALLATAQPPPNSQSRSREQRLEDQGRTAWENGRRLEAQKRFAEALASYRLAASFFEQTLGAADADRIPIEDRPPRIYLLSAKCAIDITRMTIRSGGSATAAQVYLESAEKTLRELEHAHGRKANRKQELWLSWAWAMYHLYGDVHLLQNKLTQARHDYMVASGLNPNFAPSRAIAEYIAEAQRAARKPLPNIAEVSIPPDPRVAEATPV